MDVEKSVGEKQKLKSKSTLPEPYIKNLLPRKADEKNGQARRAERVRSG
jgi:hypothetical protein